VALSVPLHTTVIELASELKVHVLIARDFLRLTV
jgi:hypothetical protein